MLNLDCVELFGLVFATFLTFGRLSQGPSLKVFVKKKVQRCGVWQIKPMTSLDQDPLSTKSNNSGFGGYSQMKIYKGCKNGRKFDILVWFGLVTSYMSS